MSWDDARFERFVNATIHMARGELPGYGYPHVVFPYSPAAEMDCIEAIRSMPGRLSQAGLARKLIPVAQVIAQVNARDARVELSDEEDYQRLESDLADLREGIVPRVAEICARQARMMAEAEPVLILCRLGALYPFGHISTLLDAIYRAGVRTTIAVAYPGTAEGTQLRFLGLEDPTGGYRGHVVT
jgi:hypothetical protein